MKKITISAILSLAPMLAAAQDYTSYNELLQKYAASNGVKYESWSGNKADKKLLNKILKKWSKVDATKLSKNDKAAFRINLYNAAMIDVVLDNYPLKSVTKLGDKDFAVFDANIISTTSGKISLNTLEKKQILTDFPDARVHFAVNCASISCPPLRNEAFVGSKLDAQLTEQAVTFSNSAHAAQKQGSSVKYSELFNWYSKDFNTKNPAVYLNKFRTNKISTGSKIDWIKYDWNLNIAK